MDSKPEIAFDQIRSNLANKLANATSIEEVDKYSSALKAVTEASRVESDVDIQRRNIGLERLKSWSTILVPLVTVLTLAGTIWNQSEQSKFNRLAAEDTQWNTTLTALTSPDQQHTQAGYTIVERLKPFLKNERFAEEAHDLSILMLGKMVDLEVFTDLLAATFAGDKRRDIEGLARIARSLNVSFKATSNMLDDIKSQQAKRSSVPLPSFRQNALLQPMPKQVDQLQYENDEIEKEIRRIDLQLADQLRARTDVRPVDLTNILFDGTDLSDTNFSYSDVEGSEFYNVTLNGADFHGVYMQGGHLFNLWWMAKFLEKGTLQFEMDQEYPFKFNEQGVYKEKPQSYSGAVLRADYVENVRRLAAQVGLQITDDMVHFGPSTWTESEQDEKN